MAETNWNFMTGGLAAASIARGVSAGFTPPSGGGTFVFGFNSLVATPGSVVLYTNLANFNPLVNDAAGASGGSIHGAIKRGVSGGPLAFAPFFLIGAAGTSVSDQCYMLGLSDNDPYEIVLRKGAPSGGLDPAGAGILRTGTVTFNPDTWHHLRLDMIVNPNGDVVLQAFESDLSVNLVTAPVWAAIPGITDFVDDALSVNSGSTPLTGGRVGYGFESADISRRGYFDHIAISRQR